MTDYATRLNELTRAGAVNGKIEAFTEVLTIIGSIADDEDMAGKTTCLRIINAIGLHQSRLIASQGARIAIARAREVT